MKLINDFELDNAWYIILMNYSILISNRLPGHWRWNNWYRWKQLQVVHLLPSRLWYVWWWWLCCKFSVLRMQKRYLNYSVNTIIIIIFHLTNLDLFALFYLDIESVVKPVTAATSGRFLLVKLLEPKTYYARCCGAGCGNCFCC